MTPCPKCKSKTLATHEYMVGGGSTENRLSGERSDTFETCHTCIICGYYAPIHNIPKMPIEVAKKSPEINKPGRQKAIPTAAELATECKKVAEYRANQKRLALLESLFMTNLRAIKAYRADNHNYTEIARKISTEAMIMSGSHLRRLYVRIVEKGER